MTNQIAKYEEFNLTKDQQKLILENLGLKLEGEKAVTETELKMYAWQSQRLGLDMFNKEIYLIGRWNSDLKRQVYTTQISIDGMRLIAERTGKYLGSDVVLDTYGEDKKLKCTVTVKKLIGEHIGEFKGIAYFDEFNQISSPLWKKMPRTMLAKCAESQALRKAFPDKFAGIYTVDEFPAEQEIETRIEAAEKEYDEKADIAKVEEYAKKEAELTQKQVEVKSQENMAKEIIEDKPSLDDPFIPRVYNG